MPATPTPPQTQASRLNGAHSSGPTTPAGKERSALNGVRHGLCGRTFFLLPDEDPAEFREHAALWLAVWGPRDLHEHEAAEAAVRATWRERRADRLEASVMADLFAADALADAEEARAVKAAATRALAILLRYRGRIERERAAAMQALEILRRRRLAAPAAANPAPRPSEPGPAAPTPPRAPTLPSEPEPHPALNRHQRRALAAVTRRAA